MELAALALERNSGGSRNLVNEQLATPGRLICARFLQNHLHKSHLRLVTFAAAKDSGTARV